MKRTLIFAALTLSPLGLLAQQVTPPCPAGTITCNNSVETMGNTSQTASADNSHAQTTQAGNSANSIASGVTINPSVQQSGNAVTQSGNMVRSDATGGNAIGNQSSNANNSSASTGASSANNGGMVGLGGTATTGASTATVAPITNTLTGAPIANTLAGGPTTATAAGGAGGLGGAASVAPITNTAAGGAQKQGQTSANTLTGGSQKTHASADNSGGNSTTSVDASDHSEHNVKSNLVVMSDQPSVPMSISPASNIAVIADTQCAPYQQVIHTPVKGLFYAITHTDHPETNYTDTLAPPTPEALDSVWGAKAVYAYTNVNISGARSISLGGGGSGGFGQGNTGTSSAMTTSIVHITMRVCRMAVERAPVPGVIYLPAPVAPVARRIGHKHVAAKACPTAKR